MNNSDVVDKTERGASEVKTRALKLPQRLRTMLIMVDGNVTVSQLLAAGEKLAAPPDFLELLLQQGLVVLIPGGAAPLLPSAPLARADTTFPQPTATLLEVDASKTERFMAARKMMNDSAVDGLGLRSFFFTLKLERCYNREDLLGLMGEYIKAIKKGSGEAAAEVLELRVRALLG